MEIPQELKGAITIIIFQNKARKVIKAIIVLSNPDSHSLYLGDSCMGR